MWRSRPGWHRQPALCCSSRPPAVALLEANQPCACAIPAGGRRRVFVMRQDDPVSIATPAEPQAVAAALTKAAIFLVVALNPGEDSADVTRSLCADVSGLVRAVGFRDLD